MPKDDRAFAKYKKQRIIARNKKRRQRKRENKNYRFREERENNRLTKCAFAPPFKSIEKEQHFCGGATQKCSTSKSAQEFIHRLNKVGDRFNIHHIYPRSRIGASWEIAEKGIVINKWNELRVSERKHVCLNVLFETVLKIKGVNGSVNGTISRTPQEICKQIELWGDGRGKINFNKLNAIQLVAWQELFGFIDNAEDAINFIKKEWDIQSEWQDVCKEFNVLKVYQYEQYWFVRNYELKWAVAIIAARYCKRVKDLNK